MEWSKGVIFLIATFWPEGLCRAELLPLSVQAARCLEDHNLPNDTVGTFTNDILDVVLVRYIE